MAKPVFDKDRALKILVDAAAMGDRTACDMWKVSAKTLYRYRERLRSDPELTRAVQLKKQQENEEWHLQRKLVLAEGLQKVRELLQEATIDNLRDVVGMLKVVGELEQTDKALMSDVNRTDNRPDTTSEETERPVSEVEAIEPTITLQ